MDYGLRHLSRRHSSRMAKRKRIYHGKAVHRAKKHVKKDLFDILRPLFVILGFVFPPIWWALSASGAAGIAGENVAMMPKGRVKGMKRPIRSDGDIARALHRSWMSSPGHRKNILTASFTKVGIGVRHRGNNCRCKVEDLFSI